MTAALFRTRFPYVCERCDLGYRRGRLAGRNSAGELCCATCLVGADPDVDGTPLPHLEEETTPCTPQTPTLFDDPAATP